MPNKFTPDKQKAWRQFCDDAALREGLIASVTKDYLDIRLSYPQTKELLMWGLVDKYSGLQDFLPRPDGVEKRPVLSDSNYRPKLMRKAVAAALKAAPVRA